MADFSVTVSDPITLRHWAEDIEIEALKRTHIYQFMGESPDSAIVVHDQLGKKHGDRLTVALAQNLTGTGVFGNAALEGSEVDVTINTDDIFLNLVRNGVVTDSIISEQRMSYDFLENVAKPQLAKWLANLMDTSFFNQVAGISTASLQLVGNNAGAAPGASFLIVASGGAAASEGTISASPTGMSFTLPLIDELVRTAETQSVALEPFMTPNGPKYALFMHPRVAEQMKTRSAANTITWFDYSRSWIEGGMTSDNPIRNPQYGALGEYNNVLLFSNSRLPLAGAQTTVRRSVFIGRQAANAVFGIGYDRNRLQFVVENFDYNSQVGVAINMIWGMSKAVYNSKEYGALVLSTGGVA